MLNLKDVWMSFANHKEGSWVIGAQDAQLLYNIVKTHDIKRVLDLGTGIGCAASVIALALHDKGVTDYEIHGIEQFEKCVKLSQELIPKELNEHIYLHREDVEQWQHPKIPFQHFSIYQHLPDGEWDLILTDGSAPYLYGDVIIENPNGDVMKMMSEGKGIKQGTIICWDERIAALKLVERYYGDNFYVTNPNNQFNVLEAKMNASAMKFEDVKVQQMKDIGYL